MIFAVVFANTQDTKLTLIKKCFAPTYFKNVICHDYQEAITSTISQARNVLNCCIHLFLSQVRTALFPWQFFIQFIGSDYLLPNCICELSFGCISDFYGYLMSQYVFNSFVMLSCEQSTGPFFKQPATF